MTDSSIRTWTLTPGIAPGSDFPGLWSTLEPAKQLHAQGTERALALLAHLPDRGLGIVGTRDPRPASALALRRWVLKLAGESLVIVSGFARGIDAAAHRAALDAGLPTVAVLGAGVDHPYPTANHELRRDLLKRDGLLISEFPSDSGPYKSNFLQRNRLIAGWSQATLVIEAGHASGALNTASWARKHERVCFAVPAQPDDDAFAGNRRLLEDDAWPARPFWDTYSLGSVWLEYATLGLGAAPRRALSRLTSDERAITRHVNEMTSARGGISAEELLDWAIGLGWTPQRYFVTLQKALSERLFEDERGTLLGRS